MCTRTVGGTGGGSAPKAPKVDKVLASLSMTFKGRTLMGPLVSLDITTGMEDLCAQLGEKLGFALPPGNQTIFTISMAQCPCGVIADDDAFRDALRCWFDTEEDRVVPVRRALLALALAPLVASNERAVVKRTKITSRGEIERFEKEVALLLACSHRNVVQPLALMRLMSPSTAGPASAPSAKRAVSRSIADTRSALDAVASLERSASRESRADREWLTRAASAAKPLPPERPARLAGTWNVYEGDFDLFRGVGGEGREIFLWCRRTGSRDATTSSGVMIDSDLLFVGLLEEDDDDVETACASGIVCVGWTTEPCVVGRFELRRKVAS